MLMLIVRAVSKPIDWSHGMCAGRHAAVMSLDACAGRYGAFCVAVAGWIAPGGFIASAAPLCLGTSRCGSNRRAMRCAFHEPRSMIARASLRHGTFSAPCSSVRFVTASTTALRRRLAAIAAQNA